MEAGCSRGAGVVSLLPLLLLLAKLARPLLLLLLLLLHVLLLRRGAASGAVVTTASSSSCSSSSSSIARAANATFPSISPCSCSPLSGMGCNEDDNDCACCDGGGGTTTIFSAPTTTTAVSSSTDETWGDLRPLPLLPPPTTATAALALVSVDSDRFKLLPPLNSGWGVALLLLRRGLAMAARPASSSPSQPSSSLSARMSGAWRMHVVCASGKKEGAWLVLIRGTTHQQRRGLGRAVHQLHYCQARRQGVRA